MIGVKQAGYSLAGFLNIKTEVTYFCWLCRVAAYRSLSR
jgi:hypothetical protein